MAGLFESINGIPQSNFETIKGHAFGAVENGFSECKILMYKNNKVSFKELHGDAVVKLITDNGLEFDCKEGEDLTWLFM